MGIKRRSSNIFGRIGKSQFILLVAVAVIGGASGAISGWALPNRNSMNLESRLVEVIELLAAKDLEVRRDIYGPLAKDPVINMLEDEQAEQVRADALAANAAYDAGNFAEATRLWDGFRPFLLGECSRFEVSFDASDVFQNRDVLTLDKCDQLAHPTIDSSLVAKVFPSISPVN